MKIMKRCPRCGGTNTEPLRNFGRAIPGRYTCYDCKPFPQGKCWSEYPGDVDYVNKEE